MNGKTIKQYAMKFNRVVPQRFPATAWQFSSKKPENGLTIDIDDRSCIFKFFENAILGKKLCFSAGKTGCPGGAYYLGFKSIRQNPGRFLSENEGFKKNVALGNAFYDEINAPIAKKKYLVMEPIKEINDDALIEVVNLWVDSLSLTGLVTLANFDRKTNDNVLIPFASGCQSVWTIPFKEKERQLPKCVAGLMDPAARRYFPNDTVSFSMPANRFVKMTENINDSFLVKELWANLFKRNEFRNKDKS